VGLFLYILFFLQCGNILLEGGVAERIAMVLCSSFLFFFFLFLLGFVEVRLNSFGEMGNGENNLRIEIVFMWVGFD